MTFGQLVGFVFFCVALYILWTLRTVVLLALAAIFFATVINRLVRLLQRLSLKRGYAVILALVLVSVAVGGASGIVLPSLAEQIPAIADRIPQAIEKLQNELTWATGMIPDSFFEEVSSLAEIARRFLDRASPLTGRVFGIFSTTINAVLDIILAIAVTIMLVINPKPYRRMALVLFPSFYRRRADRILSDTEGALVGWFIGILFNALIITIFTGLGLWLLKVPLPLTNAFIAGLLTFVPTLGPTLSVIPPAALGLLEAPWKAGAVLALYIVVQQVESNILTPIVMKKQVSLLPAVGLLAQVAFASLFGVLGLFLALPSIVVAQVWLKEVLVEDILNRWQHQEKVRSPDR